MLDPAQELRAFFRLGACHLMGQVRADVAVHEHDLALIQRSLYPRLRFVAITRVKQRGETRIDTFERPKITVQEFSNHVPKPGVVLREGRGIDGDSLGLQREFQQTCLRLFSAPVNSFDGNQQSLRCHGTYQWQGEATCDSQFNCIVNLAQRLRLR